MRVYTQRTAQAELMYCVGPRQLLPYFKPTANVTLMGHG